MRIKLKHGTPTAVANYIGEPGEMVVADGSNIPRVMDGVTPGGKSLDGRRYNTSQPTMVGPVDGSTGVPTVVSLQSSAFVGDGYHTASYWEVSIDPNFITLAFSSGRDTENLTSLTDLPILARDTTYYARVCHEGANGGVSIWSDSTSFTCRSAGGYVHVQTIEGIAPANYTGDDVNITPDGSYMTVAGLDEAPEVYGRVGGSWLRTGELTESLRVTSGSGKSKTMKACISGDGSVVVTHDHSNDTNGVATGVLYVYERALGEYVEVSAISPNINNSGVNIKQDLAISADGATIVLGGNSSTVNGNGNAGEVYVITKVNDAWQVSATLYAPVPKAAARFGLALHLSDDASTLFISSVDGVHVFKKVGNSYIHSSILVGSGASPEDGIVTNISSSADGSVVAWGAGKRNGGGISNSGHLYIFRLENSVYAEDASIVPPSRAVGGHFGRTVSVSGDGSTVVTSTNNVSVEGNSGILVFSMVSNVWTLRATRELDNTASAFINGPSIGTSDDGAVIVVGDSFYKSPNGGVFVFA